MMKAEFMSLWDGVSSAGESDTGYGNRILVLGATNRPHDIDTAILRRMPKRFPIKLPDSVQRRKVLDLVCNVEMLLLLFFFFYFCLGINYFFFGICSFFRMLRLNLISTLTILLIELRVFLVVT